MTETSRHYRGGPSRATSNFEEDVEIVDDDGDRMTVDLFDEDHADVASYVYPSNKRSAAAAAVVGGPGTSSRRYGRQTSAPSGSSASAAYDTVDSSRVQRSTSRTDTYEKVSSCRYVHIWQMPLPKAPDE